MVENKNNWLIYGFFSWYIGRRIDRHYHRIEFNDVKIDQDKSILLIANHYSWWDGFIYFQLNKLLFKKKFHIMILEETIIKNSFFRYLGAFSVAKGSKDILKTLKFAGGLLDDPKNLLLIFPQGKLYSNFTGQVVFEKGLEKLVNFSKKQFSYILAASFTEGFARPKPTAFIYLKKAEAANFASLADVQSAYHEHYLESRMVQTAIVE